MADTDHPADDDIETSSEATSVDETDAAEDQPAEKLQLDVNIEERSACERHISVTIPREEIDRFFDKEFSEMMPEAQVPGFRPGRAPRKLVEAKFRKDVSGKVKSELLMASLSQISEDESLSAINEPDIDLEAVDIPDEGPLTFEFDLEVRPEFELPKWKGMTLDKPIRDFSDEDVDGTLRDILARRGRLVPLDGPAEAGDYITTNLSFKHGDAVVSESAEEVIRIRPVLSFRDGQIEKFDRLMVGVTAGETREGKAELTQDAPNAALRGKTVTAVFEVLDVKRLELPELTEELLDELGGFELEADLRDAIKDQLDRQLQYDQHQRAREQITASLTVAASWDLPPELLERQSHRELERAILELQRSGFSEDEIRAHENELRQNSLANTAQALKEHFILERIAEDEDVDAEESDFADEISLIAAQANESARRVRARLEKSGNMDALRNQIVERKVIELILEHAKFIEVPYEFERGETEAVDQTAGGRQTDIPEAQPEGGEAAPGGRPEDTPIRE